jgi:hypothetical protein
MQIATAGESDRYWRERPIKLPNLSKFIGTARDQGGVLKLATMILRIRPTGADLTACIVLLSMVLSGSAQLTTITTSDA